MNRRLVLAFGLFAVLAASAGCTSIFGSGSISDERLGQEASYDWETNQNVTYNVTSDQYQAIYKMDEKTTLEIYQEETLGEHGPVEISSVQFQYPNDTVVGHDQIRVKKTKEQTIITPPQSEGKLAYTAPRQGKTFAVPTHLNDQTYEVIIPKGMRVDMFLLSDVRPGSYTSEMQDERVHVVWDEPVSADSISVRYYLARDKFLFGGVVGIALVAGLIGLAYFRMQIRELEQKREEMGLNADISDDDFGGGGPPPGMQ
ncbi:hypothetical protein SAMN05421858_1338 [Haladaptatus litoreus]|uniref:Uncharacterized protein n=1 Tax=Haladaptatus litoreus TaxID=553468 RepID=A0A1N6XZN3_9EURY|nr:DUF5803 family protein [Haladaptatus litoreus]SIR07777.1 hypothetical protein SAMN05421858_1338 [Haladaptatus litoreus]